MVVYNNILAGASGATSGAAGAYQIDRSLRFNSGDSAKLTRSASTAGNQKTWTWSAWVKRASLAASDQYLFGAQGSGQFFILGFTTTHEFFINPTAGVTGATLKSSAKFRDPSAWYHIVVAVDTTQSTASDRVRVYINGDEITSWATSTYPSQNTDWHVNSNVSHSIGASTQSTGYCNVYMADIYHIDGTQLAATDFGEYNDNNVWQPIEYSGTYGTNGFHLDFSDNSSASALGTDAAGSNDWTVNNLDPVESIGLPSGYTADSSTYSGTLSSIETDDTNGITAASSHIDFDLGASYTVGTVTAKFINNQGSASANYRIELHGNSSYSDLLANSATVNSAAGTEETITHDFGSTSAQYLRFSYQGGGRVGTLRFLSTTGATSGNADCDSLIDTPTNYTAESGNNGGNYCTWNPLSNDGNSTLSNGNLQSQATAVGGNTFGTIKMPNSGKYYWECEITALSTSAVAGFGLTLPYYTGNYIVSVVGIWYVASTGKISYNSTQVSYGATFGLNDIIGIAVDCDNNKIEFFKNGVSQGEADPSTYNLDVTDYVPGAGDSSGAHNNTIVGNFGQRPFAYTPPTGYKSLCTTNLDDPTIADGSTAMDIVTYTGDGQTRSITSLSFSPDWLWFKTRNTSREHYVYDIVRGVQRPLYPDLSNQAETGPDTDAVSSFDSNGWTMGGDAGSNNNNDTYVCWAWDAGSSTVSNTDGSITSNVRANQTAGFSIVSYTGSGSNATVGHGLNASPKWVLVKSRDTGQSWQTFHVGIGNTKSMHLNTTDTPDTASSYWQDTDPTSSVFSIGTSNSVNQSSTDFIAYCFAPVEGYSAFGHYTGNGSSDGPVVFTGFRPAWLLIKNTTDGTDNDYWVLFDTARNEYNLADKTLIPNLNNAEGTTTHGVDFLSNGFKLRATHTSRNASGDTYIYAAFAEHPFKTSRAR